MGKSLTKSESRRALVREVYEARRCEAVMRQVQQQGMAHVSRATMAAEMLGYDDLDEALETITEEDLVLAEAEASANGASGHE